MQNIKTYGSIIAFLILFGFIFSSIKEKVEASFFTDEFPNPDATNTTTQSELQEQINLQPNQEENSASTSFDQQKTMERDPNLIGQWHKVGKYVSGGLNKEAYTTFYPDGTLEENTNVMGDWFQNENFSNLMNYGCRWFTNDGAIYINSPDGQTQWKAFYHFADHFLIIQWNQNQEFGYTRVQ